MAFCPDDATSPNKAFRESLIIDWLDLTMLVVLTSSERRKKINDVVVRELLQSRIDCH